MNNTIVRSLSGTCFVLAMIAGLLVNRFLYAGLFILIMSGMMIEFYRFTMERKYVFSRSLAILTGDIFFILVFLQRSVRMPAEYLGLVAVPILVLMINSLYVKDKKEFWKFSHIYTGLLYIALPMSISSFIAFKNGEFNGILLLAFFILIWASDVGGYVFGVTIGKKYGGKLFPSISPKKSWAGFWGGMLCSVLASVLMKYTGIFDFSLIHCIILAILMDVAGVYGDLFESQWKRCYDLKDSGNIIPGHGGLLDRFDSTLFAFPVGVMYLVMFGLLS